MTERPILFSGPMVKAILAGTKTQTRRVVNPQPDVVPDYLSTSQPQGHVFRIPVKGQRGTYDCLGKVNFAERFSRHGKPGDRLWVRETFLTRKCGGGFGRKGWNEYAYRADQNPRLDGWKWTPAIHMPRVACRLLLEVKAVRVERLQDLPDADAIAEGVKSPRPDFPLLWDSINAKRGYGWDVNPWVWVIEFSRVSSDIVGDAIT